MRLTTIFSIGLTLLCCSCEKKVPPATPPPPTVTTYTVEPSNVPVVYDFIGFAESSHLVEIRARVQGYLDKIAYGEGDLVQEGQLLFQLDPNQIQAQVEQSKADVARQEALLTNAVLTVNRLQPLYEQKAASKKDLDNAIANQLSTTAALESAKAQLTFNLLNLSYTTITSPISGYANKSKWREGSLITPGSDGLLTTVYILDPIWVYFTISDNDILTTHKQTSAAKIIMPKDNDFVVELQLSDGSTFPYKGKLNYSSPIYDQATGTLLARAQFPNPPGTAGLGGYLHPGEFVRVKVHGAERPNALQVPQRAVVQKKSGVAVYLIQADDSVILQDITVDSWAGDYQIVTNGLKPGDKIVVDGIGKVRPGGKVTITGPWIPSKTSLPQSDTL